MGKRSILIEANNILFQRLHIIYCSVNKYLINSFMFVLPTDDTNNHRIVVSIITGGLAILVVILLIIYVIIQKMKMQNGNVKINKQHVSTTKTSGWSVDIEGNYKAMASNRRNSQLMMQQYAIKNTKPLQPNKVKIKKSRF